MDLDTFYWLLTPEGQAALDDLARHALAEGDVLRELERLRTITTPDRARAALEVALMRRRARAKFPHADRLYFTREALEQASAAPVAAHRAARLAGDRAPTALRHIGDLCCSVGGDALAFAEAGLVVTAVDSDPLRLAMCRANAEALGLASRVTTLQQDLLAATPPLAEALFCDPGRRAGGRRRFSAGEYEPPLAHVLGWRAQTPALTVKLAPGIDLADLPADAEVEFVSLEGELKEAALWCGPLATAHRRATVLRSRESRALRGPGDGWAFEVHTLQSLEASSDPCQPLISAPLAFLYEPDPAVIRAGLVRDLGGRLGAAQLDSQIAYLTAPAFTATPFARAWPVIAWLPFNLKALRAQLRGLGAGEVTVKKRGSPLDTDALARQLRGPGERPLVVVLTRVAATPAALVCDPVVQ